LAEIFFPSGQGYWLICESFHRICFSLGYAKGGFEFVERLWRWPGRKKERLMKNHTDERIFTKKGVAIGVVFFSIYGVILFSLDPEWVRWAGSMTMGALYVPDPPPPLFSQPQEAFQMATVFSLLSLSALVCLMAIMGEVKFGWLSRLMAHLRNEGLGGFENNSNGLRAGREVLHWTLIPTANSGNIKKAVQTGDFAAVGEELATDLPHSRRAISGNLEGGGPENLQSLLREAVSSGNVDLF
jgi:hypothetical protein